VQHQVFAASGAAKIHGAPSSSMRRNHKILRAAFRIIDCGNVCVVSL
jgi:hypothetical protein